jgi:hypothetical protein
LVSDANAKIDARAAIMKMTAFAKSNNEIETHSPTSVDKEERERACVREKKREQEEVDKQAVKGDREEERVCVGVAGRMMG